MRIHTLAIDGYGRFAQYLIELAPGFQVIYGPNEQGKSTLRNFIGDMLYGQKRSALQRLFEDANELRCPWMNPDAYGGRLIYRLDDGRQIEVFRRFDRKNEMVQVYDRTHAADITNDFELLRNREPQFALRHIGLSKEVFLNTATISHLTLDDLGDEDALAQIRERILAIADTGEERSCADATLRRLKARIETIGQPGSRTKPLPSARARRAELEREYEQACALRDELAETEKRRQAIREEIAALRERRAGVESDLEALARIARAEQLREAQQLEGRINEATQRCFLLRAASDFPLDMTPEVLQTNTRLLAARDHLERTRKERTQLEAQIAAEEERLGASGTRDIPDEYDQRLADIAAAIQRLRDRLDNTEAARNGSESRLHAAEQEFAAVPDFSRLAGDPLTWINQLASSFRVAVRCRDDDCQQRKVLREQVKRRRESMADLEKLFGECPDFANEAREYEVTGRIRQEEAGKIRAVIEQLYETAEEYGERIAAFGKFALVAMVFFVGFLLVAFTTENRGVYVPTIILAISAAAFSAAMVHARAKTRSALRQLDGKQAEMQALWAAEDEQRGRIDRMIVNGGCQTLRELDGKHDQYRQAVMELTALEAALEQQERKADEVEQRVTQLFNHLKEVFASMGENLKSESDLDEAAGRTVGRYQVYRDAKRRIVENKDQIKKHNADEVKMKEDLEVVLEQERTLALEARRMMRENGYPEESRHDSALMALRSYRIRNAGLLKGRGRIDALREKLDDLHLRIEEDRAELTHLEEALSRLVALGKCETLDQWREKAVQARQYADARDRVTSLQEQLRALLRNSDLNALRATVEADEPVSEPPARSAEDLKRDFDRLGQEMDARMKEEHALHLALTERAAGARSISEIEEERAIIEQRVRALEFEMDAASYAMALIEEIARDKHARIAPRLAACAGEFLKEITCGAYDEVLINRDLRISIRIPQTSIMTENPERILSKGTVDQLYLALRLAMVQAMSDTGESIPLLLDDPFSSYDDQRLERALELLARLSAQNQVLLFTCRDDVVRAAETVNAPILRLEDATGAQSAEGP